MASTPDHYVPEPGPDGLRAWEVASGVLRGADGTVVMVENKRRNGSTDWSTPGGVVDPGEAPLEALTREVVEETGLAVAAWEGPLYVVEVVAPGFGFRSRCEVHAAVSFSGEVHIDDPDRIVVAVDLVAVDDVADRLATAPRWVAEPMLEHLHDGVADGRTFSYRLEGSSAADRSIVRL